MLIISIHGKNSTFWKDFLSKRNDNALKRFFGRIWAKEDLEAREKKWSGLTKAFRQQTWSWDLCRVRVCYSPSSALNERCAVDSLHNVRAEWNGIKSNSGTVKNVDCDIIPCTVKQFFPTLLWSTQGCGTKQHIDRRIVAVRSPLWITTNATTESTFS